MDQSHVGNAMKLRTYREIIMAEIKRDTMPVIVRETVRGLLRTACEAAILTTILIALWSIWAWMHPPLEVGWSGEAWVVVWIFWIGVRLMVGAHVSPARAR